MVWVIGYCGYEVVVVWFVVGVVVGWVGCCGFGCWWDDGWVG